MERILLGQLSANGDCLYATILARQIKHDYPNATLTWAISEKSKQVIDNNPDIDDVWEFPMPSVYDQRRPWLGFLYSLERIQKSSYFDKVVLSQISPANFQNYDGTIRPSILRAYGSKITVPIRCMLHLKSDEWENTDSFSRNHKLNDRDGCILFECNSHSGQSDVTPEFAKKIARIVLKDFPNHAFILSSHLPIETGDSRIIDGSTLSFRENAALTHKCDFFVGAGSGVTVATMTHQAKQLPTIILLKGGRSVYASFAHDFGYWSLDNTHILEMVDASAEKAAKCIKETLGQGFQAAYNKFHKVVEVEFSWYLHLIKNNVMIDRRFVSAAWSLNHTVNRYGWTPELLDFAEDLLIPRLIEDRSLRLPHIRQFVDRFIGGYSSALS